MTCFGNGRANAGGARRCSVIRFALGIANSNDSCERAKKVPALVRRIRAIGTWSQGRGILRVRQRRWWSTHVTASYPGNV